LTTDLLATDKAVERISVFQGKETTSTASEDEYGGLEIPQTIAVSPPLYARWEVERQANPWGTFAEGFDYLSVIEPILVQGEGVESVIQMLAKRLATIPDVLAVGYSTDRNIYLVWTFIREVPLYFLLLEWYHLHI